MLTKSSLAERDPFCSDAETTTRSPPKRGGFGAWSVPHSPSEPPRVGRLCPGGAGTRGMVPRATTTPKMLLALGPRLLQHQHVPGSIQTPVDWECWGELVLFQHRDQLRPGDKTPQEPFTSRAKLTSFEGREEPSAGPCPLQTSGHLLHWLFPQWENNVFLGFNHQGKTSSLTELPTPAPSPACPPRSLSHLQSPPILTFPSLISSGKGKTSNHWIIEQEREHGRCSTCKPRRIH